MKINDEGSNKQNVKPLFIVDWDDTLVPSNIMNFDQCGYQTFQNVQLINHIEDLVIGVLIKIQLQGSLLILTNSENGWVKYFSEKYFSREFLSYLDTLNIVSAKSNHKHETCKQRNWKKLALIEYHKKKNHHTHYISIGDNHYDHYCVSSVIKEEDDTLKTLKSFKLLENPDIYSFIKQLNLLSDFIDRLAVPGNLYIMSVVEYRDNEFDVSVINLPHHYSYDYVNSKEEYEEIERELELLDQIPII